MSQDILSCAPIVKTPPFGYASGPFGMNFLCADASLDSDSVEPTQNRCGFLADSGGGGNTSPPLRALGELSRYVNEIPRGSSPAEMRNFDNYARATFAFGYVSIMLDMLYASNSVLPDKHQQFDILDVATPPATTQIYIGDFMAPISRYWTRFRTQPPSFPLGQSPPIEATRFGGPRPSSAAFAMPQPTVLSTGEPAFEMRLNRCQLDQLYQTTPTAARNQFVTALMRSMLNDSMGYFLDGGDTSALKLELATLTVERTSETAHSIYDMGAGVDAILVSFTEVPLSPSSARVQMSVIDNQEDVVAVSYAILVRVVSFSQMGLVYYSKYWPSALSQLSVRVATRCDAMFSQTSLAPVPCFESLCRDGRDSGLCDAANVCPNEYLRPYSYLFSNYEVEQAIVQGTNVVCECFYPQNLPTYVPLPTRGSDFESAVCFDLACSNSQKQAILGDTWQQTCSDRCGTYRGWLEKGKGQNAFYRPNLADVDSFSKACGGAPDVGGDEAYGLVVGLYLVAATLISCLALHVAAAALHRMDAVHPVGYILVLVLVAVALTAAGSANFITAKCETFALDGESTCTFLGFRIPTALCKNGYNCQCRFDEDCCSYCEPEPSCYSISGSAQGDSLCSAALEAVTCNTTPGCEFVTRPPSAPDARGQNCPNITSSASQKCSCRCKAGECVTTSDSVIVQETSVRFDDFGGVVLISLAVAILVAWGGTAAAHLADAATWSMLLAIAASAIVIATAVGVALQASATSRVADDVRRESDLQNGRCFAQTATIQQACGVFTNDSVQSFACVEGSALPNTIYPNSEGLCDECGAAYACVPVDASSSECTFVGFGNGDFDNSDCDGRCALRFVCGDSGECLDTTVEPTALGVAVSDCADCVFAFNCVNDTCVPALPGAGTFSDASCTIGRSPSDSCIPSI